MAEQLSIYGHDTVADPRYAPVGGRVPIGVIGYYPCCETKEAPCDKVCFRLPDGSSTEFLLGRFGSERPRQLWRRVGFYTPRGVQLLECVGRFPCTRESDAPHEWWTWRWATGWRVVLWCTVSAIRRHLVGKGQLNA